MTTQSAAAPTELDLLEHVEILVPCAGCGQHYGVSLRDVLLSQDTMHEGCPVPHETECPQLTYAALADDAALHELEQSWTAFSRKVHAAGFDLTVCAPPGQTGRNGD